MSNVTSITKAHQSDLEEYGKPITLEIDLL